MTYENIEITNQNFCIGPKAGTFCYVDVSGSNAVVRVKNSSGGTVSPAAIDFYPTDTIPVEIDSYPKNIVQSFKYIGPINKSDFFNNLPFYTLERYTTVSGTSSQFTIRRWLRDSTNNRLTLDKTVTKNSSGNYQYDAYAMSLDYITTSMYGATDSGTGYITVTSVSGIQIGDELMIGPGTDDVPAINLNAVEYAYVTNIIDNDLYLSPVYGSYVPPYYQYQNGDDVTVFKDIFVFSDKSYGNDINKGSLYRTNFYGTIIEHDNQGSYYGVRAADWCEYFDGPSFIKGNNLVILDTTTLSTLGWYKPKRSMYMYNMNADDVTTLPIYDIEFDDIDIYKLQDSITKYNDNGDLSTIVWTTYNYVLDTLSQYSSSITMYPTPIGVLSQGDTITIKAIVRNQYGFGLSNKNVQFYISGDASGYMNPLNGQALTDINGVAEIEYISGIYSMLGDTYEGYNGIETIRGRTDGGYVGNGSVYVWDRLYLPTFGSYSSECDTLIKQIPTLLSGDPDTSWDIYTELYLKQILGLDSEISIINKSKFSFPGGNWYLLSAPSDNSTLLRQVIVPILSENGTGDIDVLIGQYNALYQRNKSDTSGHVPLPAIPSLYVFEPKEFIKQIEHQENDLQFSQVIVSRHVLTGNQATAELDQYVFVQDAIPGFWSYKNPTTTDIWIRLLPFADSLNSSSLIFNIREMSYAGDTGWYSIVDGGAITTFDAGGGLLGVEFQWYNPSMFHHNAVVYVHLEIIDGAGNVLMVEYWFQIISDYKAPYLENLDPAREETDVSINSPISFDIKDVGTGVDINSFLMFVNGEHVQSTITEIGYDHYHVVYNHYDSFIYGSIVDVSVQVNDSSAQSNTLYDMWRFYIEGSTGPWFDFDSFTPKPCSRGVIRKNTSVSFNVYDINNTGIDRDSILVSIGGKYRDVKITPIIYRII